MSPSVANTAGEGKGQIEAGHEFLTGLRAQRGWFLLQNLFHPAQMLISVAAAVGRSSPAGQEAEEARGPGNMTVYHLWATQP